MPILMYHGISNAKRHNGHPYYETTTSPDVFAKQLSFLKQNGYKSIMLNELPAALEKPAEPDAKPFVITFDDGLLDFFVTGFPILKANGFSATVFLPAGLMGGKLAGQNVMSWGDAKRLSAEGVVFGSHSLTHPVLVKVDKPKLLYEISQSKKLISKELGQETVDFSFPYAFPEHDSIFIRLLKESLSKFGYRRGLTTRIGRTTFSDSPFLFKRLPINDHDDLCLLRAKLEGGYDWMYRKQLFIKKINMKLIKKILDV